MNDSVPFDLSPKERATAQRFATEWGVSLDAAVERMVREQLHNCYVLPKRVPGRVLPFKKSP